jgi:hypothetical protein
MTPPMHSMFSISISIKIPPFCFKSIKIINTSKTIANAVIIQIYLSLMLTSWFYPQINHPMSFNPPMIITPKTTYKAITHRKKPSLLKKLSSIFISPVPRYNYIHSLMSHGFPNLAMGVVLLNVTVAESCCYHF